MVGIVQFAKDKVVVLASSLAAVVFNNSLALSNDKSTHIEVSSTPKSI